jgi:hypothetical protein
MGIIATGYLCVLYEACVGEEFEDTNEIGVVLSLRERRNLIKIWIKDCVNQRSSVSVIKFVDPIWTQRT